MKMFLLHPRPLLFADDRTSGEERESGEGSGGLLQVGQSNYLCGDTYINILLMEGRQLLLGYSNNIPPELAAQKRLSGTKAAEAL